MIPTKQQELILSLTEQKVSINEMVRLLHVSRNTIRRVIRQGKVRGVHRENKTPPIEPLLPLLFERCQGNVVRINEILASEYGYEIAYSTLTRLVRAHELRMTKPPSGEYHFDPGVEMQHDTSPHQILIGDKKMTLQCAALVLAYSRRLFIKYYLRWTRFEAKAFFTEAIQFMQGACQRCVVDNSSVVLAGGSGSDAIIAPEMALFLQYFGSQFMAHAIGHPNRKARVERPFFYVERNFIPGRQFESIPDLNQQALTWCCEIANQKIKRSLGMSPEAAYVQEKAHLLPLPSFIPPVYELHHRIVDSHGFINLETQSYSVHQKYIGKQMDVYKYEETIEIYDQHDCIAKHPRLTGERHQKSRLKGHHEMLRTRLHPSNPSTPETLLRHDSELLNHYLDQLKKRVRGKGHFAMQRLLNLKRTYPKEAFYQAIKQASHYGLYDIHRLETIILKFIAGDFFNLGE
jgi:transposase